MKRQRKESQRGPRIPEGSAWTTYLGADVNVHAQALAKVGGLKKHQVTNTVIWKEISEQ